MQPEPHILICPLNWGLGHATRMIPLIMSFLEKGCRVTVASSGAPLRLLTREFQNKINYTSFPGTEIRYARGDAMMFKMALKLPALLWSMRKEQKTISRMIRRHEPDILISDNRYGVRSKQVLSVFVTHQLRIQLPASIKWLENSLNHINRSLIKKFELCLVPDMHEYPGLAGRLSHEPLLPNLRYTGILSRFAHLPSPASHPLDMPERFLLVILSGPEPQRGILETMLRKQLQKYPVVWFLGLPGKEEAIKSGNHIFYNHASTHIMANYIQKSELVICRSGYSSVMDLCVWGKKAVMIPTPGQTEQEYLAAHLHASGYIAALPQNKIHRIDLSVEEAKQKKGLPVPSNHTSVDETVEFLLHQLKNRQKKQRNTLQRPKVSGFWSWFAEP